MFASQAWDEECLAWAAVLKLEARKVLMKLVDAGLSFKQLVTSRN